MLSISTNNTELLTEAEAALVINCSISALQKSRSRCSTKIDEGLAPKFIKLKGAVRYRFSDLEAFVNGLKQQVEMTTDILQSSNYAEADEDKDPVLNSNLDDFDWATLR